MYKYIKKDLSEEEKDLFYRQKYRNTLFGGMCIRLVVLAIIYFLFSAYDVTPYYIADDEKYTVLAERYMSVADSAIDVGAYDFVGASRYLSPFWPYVACTVSYFFGSTWSLRFLNIALSCICIALIHSLVKVLSGNERTALLAAQLYAYMPYSVMVSCFPIKDLLLTLGVLVTFLLYVRLQKGLKVSLFHWISMALSFYVMSETRGAIVEFLLLVAGVFICVRFYRKKQYLWLMFALLLIVAFLLVFGKGILNSFSVKMDSYFYKDRGDSTIALVRIDSIAQIYKLPVTYMFSQIMPLSTSWFSTIEIDNFWGPVISRLNATSYPIAIGNFLYLLFCKKKNPIFYFSSFAMYCAVIILSLGIYRHYYFLLPLAYINFAMYGEEKTPLTSNLVTVGSFALAFMIMIYSIV